MLIVKRLVLTGFLTLTARVYLEDKQQPVWVARLIRENLYFGIGSESNGKVFQELCLENLPFVPWFQRLLFDDHSEANSYTGNNKNDLIIWSNWSNFFIIYLLMDLLSFAQGWKEFCSDGLIKVTQFRNFWTGKLKGLHHFFYYVLLHAKLVTVIYNNWYNKLCNYNSISWNILETLKVSHLWHELMSSGLNHSQFSRHSFAALIHEHYFWIDIIKCCKQR